MISQQHFWEIIKFLFCSESYNAHFQKKKDENKNYPFIHKTDFFVWQGSKVSAVIETSSKNILKSILAWAGAGWVMGVDTPDAEDEVGRDGDGDCPWLTISELMLSLDGESLI